MATTRRTARRAPEDRQADRTAAASIVTDLQGARDGCTSALKALPPPAQRTVAQKRDALILRSTIILARSQLLALGVGTAADRGATDA